MSRHDRFERRETQGDRERRERQQQSAQRRQQQNTPPAKQGGRYERQSAASDAISVTNNGQAHVTRPRLPAYDDELPRAEHARTRNRRPGRDDTTRPDARPREYGREVHRDWAPIDDDSDELEPVYVPQSDDDDDSTEDELTTGDVAGFADLVEEDDRRPARSGVVYDPMTAGSERDRDENEYEEYDDDEPEDGEDDDFDPDEGDLDDEDDDDPDLPPKPRTAMEVELTGWLNIGTVNKAYDTWMIRCRKEISLGSMTAAERMNDELRRARALSRDRGVKVSPRVRAEEIQDILADLVWEWNYVDEKRKRLPKPVDADGKPLGLRLLRGPLLIATFQRAVESVSVSKKKSRRSTMR